MNELNYSQYLKEMQGKLQNKKIPGYNKIIQSFHQNNIRSFTSNILYFILDYRTSEFLYISSNSAAVHGYSPDEVIEMGPTKIMQLFHPEDCDIIENQAFVQSRNYFKYLAQSIISRLQISINFRFKHKLGHWVHIEQQFNSLLTDKNGEILTIVGNQKLLNTIPENFEIHCRISVLSPFNYAIPVFSKNYTNLSSRLIKDYTFTEKELEIIQLAGKGFSSKEIASATQKSIETIHTQRKKILEKSKCKSMSEVIYISKKNNWIH